MSRYSVLIVISLALLTLSLWAVANRPEPEPPWPARIQGISFSPYRAGQRPLDGRLPSQEEIDADLALLAGKTYAVRTYSMEGALADVPRLAQGHGINVAVGAWIDTRLDNNESELERLIEVAAANPHNVVRAIVGNEAIFLRRFLARATAEEYVYYVMEAFDQPWKRATEGAVGAYWGVYDVQRLPKFAFAEPVVEVPEWRLLAALSVVIAAITLAVLFTDSRTLRHRGRSFLAVIAYAAATTAVWIVYEYSQQYLTVGAVLVGLLLLAGMVGVMVLLLTEAHEWAEALWVTERRRPFRPVSLPDRDLPRVSIHVPAYNKPPGMLINTLDALARLDYPDYEVLVIDNNTRDPAAWEPVRDRCARLGHRFRFFHVAPLAGFKAGALNFALAETDPAAEIVAVIDSDYAVHPRWLRDLASQFQKPRIAIVQAPQDYRDAGGNAFKAMCYAEYRGFFLIGMVTRNERNAIIQHGTMTLVRRRILEEVGGWGVWCITEDAELGLRVFEAGYEATYIPCSYGRGLMPDTFVDFKRQRFRWAYGAMQILRHHAGELLCLQPTRLTRGQRYHFIAGWLPWLGDGDDAPLPHLQAVAHPGHPVDGGGDLLRLTPGGVAGHGSEKDHGTVRHHHAHHAVVDLAGEGESVHQLTYDAQVALLCVRCDMQQVDDAAHPPDGGRHVDHPRQLHRAGHLADQADDPFRHLDGEGLVDYTRIRIQGRAHVTQDDLVRDRIRAGDGDLVDHGGLLHVGGDRLGDLPADGEVRYRAANPEAVRTHLPVEGHRQTGLPLS
ncbi:MAG: glycosyltransferase [Nitrospirota bacterium]|jgi:glycosyltransferase involved in cell wall biosynthesis